MQSIIFRRFLPGAVAVAAVTLSVTLAVLQPEGNWGWAAAAGLATAAASAAGIGYLLERGLVRRVRRMRATAEALLAEPGGERSDHRARDEFEELEQSLGRVAAQVRTLVDRLRLESAQ